MARRFLILTVLALCSATAQEATPVRIPAQEGHARPAGSKNAGKQRSGPADVPSGMKERIEKMSEKDRQHFLENFSKWNDMNDGERREFREKFRSVRKLMREDAEKALKQTGLSLDPDRQEVFQLRYMQERRRIEQHLRETMNKQREELLKQATEKLKAEFQRYSKPKAP